MREAAGHSFKSSLSHAWVRDTRDDKLTGASGLYTKVYQELAGIGGDAKFHKIEAEGQFSRPLFPGMVCLGRLSGWMCWIKQA
jgi:outer membrane protein insertion porin family